MQTRASIRFWAVAALVLGAQALALQGRTALGGDVGPYYASPDIVVGRVVKVSDAPATNGNPPTVRLQIRQVLSGEVKSCQIHAIWNPPFHGIDTSGFEAELQAWESKPLEKPKVGETFILFGALLQTEDGPVLNLHGRGKVPYTPAALDREKKRIDQRSKGSDDSASSG